MATVMHTSFADRLGLMASLGLCLALVGYGCEGELSETGGCEPGATVSCACPSGQTSTQTCQSDRTWGACGCDGVPDAGSPESDGGETADTGGLADGGADTAPESGDWSVPSDNERTLVAKRVSAEISADGNLDEPAYERAQAVAIEGTGGAGDNRASARALWSDQTLYVGFEVTDDEVETPQSVDVWERDGIQMYIDRDRDRSSEGLRSGDYNFKVDAAGETATERGSPSGSVDTDLGVTVGTAESADGYRLELAVDWETLEADPAIGQRMGFLFVNHDRAGDAHDSYGWGAEDAFGTPSKWGDLRLGPETPGDDPNLED